MFSEYYKREVDRLKQSAQSFSDAHPMLAPMLAQSCADPDVERLLEGVAYLTANIQQRLDDGFPEILHGLMEVVCPQFMKPIPSLTMIQFSPKPSLMEALSIPAETYIDSIPVDGTACRFRTCSSVDVYPVMAKGVELIEKGSASMTLEEIELQWKLSVEGPTLATLDMPSLSFQLGGEYADASSLYYILARYLRHVEIVWGDKESVKLPKEALTTCGFGGNDSLWDYPPNVFPSFRLLQEYFLFPEKFLSLGLDLSQWVDRPADTDFTIKFVCETPPIDLPKIGGQSLMLGVVPAVNLFKTKADPLQLTHERRRLPLRPTGGNTKSSPIFDVENVSSYVIGDSGEKPLGPYGSFHQDRFEKPVFKVYHSNNETSNLPELELSVAYPPGAELPEKETVSAELVCTNGALPGALRVGDINQPTSNTPELVSYRNVSAPLASQPAPIGKDALWTLVSQLSLNHLSIVDATNLKELLQLYSFPGGDKIRDMANRNRIASVNNVVVEPSEKLFGRAVLRGQAVNIHTQSSSFSSKGDMYLFGCILDHFFSTSANINTYTELSFEDQVTGEVMAWPAKLGDRALH